jgi:hypothetical protein
MSAWVRSRASGTVPMTRVHQSSLRGLGVQPPVTHSGVYSIRISYHLLVLSVCLSAVILQLCDRSLDRVTETVTEGH